MWTPHDKVIEIHGTYKISSHTITITIKLKEFHPRMYPDKKCFPYDDAPEARQRDIQIFIPIILAKSQGGLEILNSKTR